MLPFEVGTLLICKVDYGCLYVAQQVEVLEQDGKEFKVDCHAGGHWIPPDEFDNFEVVGGPW